MSSYDPEPTEQVERIEWWDDYISAIEEMDEEVRSGRD